MTTNADRAREWLADQGISTADMSDEDRRSSEGLEVAWMVQELTAALDAAEARARAAERAQVVAHLRGWAVEAEAVPGPPQYEDALRDAADSVERGSHAAPTPERPAEVAVEVAPPLRFDGHGNFDDEPAEDTPMARMFGSCPDMPEPCSKCGEACCECPARDRLTALERVAEAARALHARANAELVTLDRAVSQNWTHERRGVWLEVEEALRATLDALAEPAGGEGR